MKQMGIMDPHMTRKYLLSRILGRRLEALLESILILHTGRPPVVHASKTQGRP